MLLKSITSHTHTKYNFTPLERVAIYFVFRCDSSIMGIAPVPAINGALKKAGLSGKGMDLRGE
jgi:acetyl-CoA acyltransferase 2